MALYTFKGVDINDILQVGTSSIPEYGITSVRTTNVANSKPLSCGFQINGVDIANSYAAKHQTYENNTVLSIPNGATSLRYMIVGGSGGGGGGGGGGHNNEGEDHVMRGYEGRVGQHGAVLTGTASVENYSNLGISIGAGGSGGGGGEGRVTGPSDNVNLDPGTAGSSGGVTRILGNNSNNTTLNLASGGVGGSGGTVITQPNNATRRIERGRGEGSSFKGAQYSTANVMATYGWGNTVYGVSDGVGSGNINYTPATPSQSQAFKTDWEDSLTHISSSNIAGGSGGVSGWGYNRGANIGGTGGTGSKGKATIIWLYD